MDSYWLEWIEMITRWMHFLFGIAWIGASLHFVRVDRGLVPPSDPDDLRQGTLWAIHGGGIYEFTKYKGAPASWPSDLHWSKWEAYSTWLSGMLLLTLVYYLKAELYLYGSLEWMRTPLRAVLASLSVLGGCVLIYELLIRSRLPEYPKALAWIMAGLVLGLCFLSLELFAPRAAFIHVGAVLGSIMVGNVFFGIMPAQKAFVAAVQAGNEPDLDRAEKAKQRSFFNNYFTLPVLFCMISLHFSVIYQHDMAAIGLFLVMLAGAVGRHFFNLRHIGIVQPIYLVIAAGLLATVALVVQPTSSTVPSEGDEQTMESALDPAQAASQEDRDQRALSLVQTHCAQCHAMQPTYPGFASPPAGLIYDSLATLKSQRVRAMTSIQSGYMPLGNLSGLSKADREFMVQYLAMDAVSQ